MGEVYKRVKEFKRKYPFTVAWRIKAHCKVIESHLNADEKVKYAFVAQKGFKSYDMVSTNVIALTNKRVLIAHKRFFGYFFTVITPDMFNDIKIASGFLWGKVFIDTVKEYVALSNLSKRSLPEIETSVTDYMMKEKKKYHTNINIEQKES